MISLEPEVVALRRTGAINDATAARLIAAERRDVVSLYAELRFLTWGGVMLIVSGVGLFLSRHLDQIGPEAIAAAIGIASVGCYAIYIWRWRAGRHHLADDYVLLLAALLASADVGYIESQFHLLGASWQRHFLLLAVLHGVTAYVFNSRLVLSLSITSLASYIGIESRTADALFGGGTDFAVRAFIAVAVLVIWRVVQRKPAFAPVFDHAIANLAFWGALGLLGDGGTRLLGCVIAIALAAASAWRGVRRGEEAFVVYAWIYGAIALDAQVCSWLDGDSSCLVFLIISTCGVIAGLFITHAQMRKGTR